MPENTSAHVIEVKATGVVILQETINIWHYATNDTPGTLDDFLTAFNTDVLTNLLSFMNSNAGFNTVEAQYVKGGTSFASKVVTATGVGGGDCLPPYATWDFTYMRSGARERNGYKRIAGVGESSQVNGVATAGVLAVIAGTLASLGGAVNDGSASWVPVIRRTRIGRIPQVPPKYFDISAVVFSKIGTQNSRKFGHGR
jgi:hypothetical protein